MRSKAANDWIYHCFVTPFGPLPGADDLHGLTCFDLMDEPEVRACLLCMLHAGCWPLSPVPQLLLSLSLTRICTGRFDDVR